MNNKQTRALDEQVEAIVAAELQQRIDLDALLAAASLPEMAERLRMIAALRAGECRPPTADNAQPELMRELLMSRLARAS